MAVLQDPAGAALSIWQPNKHHGLQIIDEVRQRIDELRQRHHGQHDLAGLRELRIHPVIQDLVREHGHQHQHRPVEEHDVAAGLQVQALEPFQPGVGEEVVDEERVELGADAVDAAGPLDHPRRVPVQVVIHQVGAVLQVLPLAQDIGCNAALNC